MGQQEQAKIEHTPEPWSIGSGSHVCGMWSGMIRIESPDDFHSNGIEYPDGSTRSFTNVVCGTTGHSDTARANILRIVACVNAMAGIPNPSEYRERADKAAKESVVLRADLSCAVERLNAALDELRCPDCKCADQIDAECKECGCDSPVCARDGSKTLAQAYLDALTERDSAIKERDEAVRQRDCLLAEVQAHRGLAHERNESLNCKDPKVGEGYAYTIKYWMDAVEAATKQTEAALSQSQQGSNTPSPLDEAVELLEKIADTENPEHYGNARDALHAVKLQASEFLDKHKKS